MQTEFVFLFPVNTLTSLKILRKTPSTERMLISTKVSKAGVDPREIIYSWEYLLPVLHLEERTGTQRVASLI